MRNRLTILLLRDGETSVGRYALEPRWLRRGLVTLGIAVPLVLGSIIHTGVEGSSWVRARGLAAENEVLATELDEMRSRVSQLETRVTSLSDENSRFRTLAGLDPIPSEVLEVGVGGPGTGTPESHPLSGFDAELGGSAFAVEYDLNALERRVHLLSVSLDEATDSLLAHRDLLESTPSILPTAGYLSSGFTQSRYHPIHHRPLPHEGVDIAAPAGTPILAAANGRVVRASWRSGYGNLVEIDHGYGFRTRYGHVSRFLVREGQEVERGDLIAHVGQSGIATGPNLHYEVLVGNQPTNPMNYVLSGGVP